MHIRQLMLCRPLLAAIVVFGAAGLSAHSPHNAAARFSEPGGSLPGIYATALTEADIPGHVPQAMRAALAGFWWLELEADGRYTLYDGTGSAAVEGSWRGGDEANVVIFTDERGPLACGDSDQASGTYRWTATEYELRWSVIADACVGRTLVLTAAAFFR